jgi:hypothetical protein
MSIPSFTDRKGRAGFIIGLAITLGIGAVLFTRPQTAITVLPPALLSSHPHIASHETSMSCEVNDYRVNQVKGIDFSDEYDMDVNKDSDRQLKNLARRLECKDECPSKRLKHIQAGCSDEQITCYCVDRFN